MTAAVKDSMPVHEFPLAAMATHKGALCGVQLDIDVFAFTTQKRPQISTLRQFAFNTRMHPTHAYPGGMCKQT